MADVNIGDLLTTTLQLQSDVWSDSFSSNNAFMYVLKEKKKIKKESGGYDIRRPLMYAANSTLLWFDGYDDLDITPSSPLDAAQYQWKLMSTSVSISGKEANMNKGSRERLESLIESRSEVARKTMMNGLETALYAVGTEFSGKTMGGLQGYLPTNPATGTVGGINRATWAFWRNYTRQSSAFGVPTITAANVKSEINAIMTPLHRGQEDNIDLGLLNDTTFNALQEANQSIQRFTKSELADAGFDTLVHRGAEMVSAGGYLGNIPSTVDYFLNTDYWDLTVHEDLYMSPMDPESRYPINQYATIKLMGFMGQLCCSNFALQAVRF